MTSHSDLQLATRWALDLDRGVVKSRVQAGPVVSRHSTYDYFTQAYAELGSFLTQSMDLYDSMCPLASGIFIKIRLTDTTGVLVSLHFPQLYRAGNLETKSPQCVKMNE